MHYNRELLRTSLSFFEVEKLPPGLLSEEFALAEIRNVVARCWIVTPKEKRNRTEIASQVKRLLDKVLRQLEEDLAEMEK